MSESTEVSIRYNIFQIIAFIMLGIYLIIDFKKISGDMWIIIGIFIGFYIILKFSIHNAIKNFKQRMREIERQQSW